MIVRSLFSRQILIQIQLFRRSMHSFQSSLARCIGRWSKMGKGRGRGWCAGFGKAWLRKKRGDASHQPMINTNVARRIYQDGQRGSCSLLMDSKHLHRSTKQEKLKKVGRLGRGSVYSCVRAHATDVFCRSVYRLINGSLSTQTASSVREK